MRRGRRRGLVTAAVVVAVAVPVGVKYGRYHVLPKRFGIVEPGRIYRGGDQEAWPYERLVEDYGIRTIVTLLNDEPEERRERVERQIAAAHGVQVRRIPMPGDGRGAFDALEAAADVMADEAGQPVFVHCAAGVHRTGAAVAVYRMRHQGWPLDQALAEAAANEVDDRRAPALVEHLRAYHRERIEARTEAVASP